MADASAKNANGWSRVGYRGTATILKVASEIVRHQDAVWAHWPCVNCGRDLDSRDAISIMNHVSRVTSNKIYCPRRAGV